MTDANAGLGSVAWALGGDVIRLRNIMSESMKHRRAVYLRSAPTDIANAMPEIEASKDRTMREVEAYMLTLAPVGLPAPPRLAHFARCVALGFTKENEIRLAFESEYAELPILLQADWSSGLVLYEKAFDETERIIVEKVERSGLRAKLVVRGEDTGRQMLLYPHYKNSYVDRTGSRIPADCWVATACFNIWVR